MLRAKVAVFVELYNMNRRLAEQATMLRERLNTELPPGDAAEHAAVLPELSKRLTSVEGELTRVLELARKDGDPSLTGPLSDLSNRLKHRRCRLRRPHLTERQRKAPGEHGPDPATTLKGAGPGQRRARSRASQKPRRRA